VDLDVPGGTSCAFASGGKSKTGEGWRGSLRRKRAKHLQKAGVVQFRAGKLRKRCLVMGMGKKGKKGRGVAT